MEVHHHPHIEKKGFKEYFGMFSQNKQLIKICMQLHFSFGLQKQF
jgi:hypothetical protein